MSDKVNGKYYTPQKLALHIAVRSLGEKNIKNISILEPGCGDGRILREVLKRLNDLNAKNISIDLVEKDRRELQKAITETKVYLNIISNTSSFVAGDYLNFHFKSNKQYDLIVGNPPYIKKGYLSNDQRKLIKNIHEQAGLSGFVKNIWTAFLISAVLKLKIGGALAFVLPSELLQTNYSNEIRDFLFKKFSKVEIFSFQELVFENIEQDVVVLFASGRSDSGCKQLEFLQLQNLDSLEKEYQSNISLHTHVNGTKWTNYILTEEELSFIKILKSRLPKVGDYCSTSPGIVTAANSFFIKDEEFVKKNHLTMYAKQILQKSSFTQNKVVFSETDWNNLRNKGSPCYLLDFTAKPVLTKSAYNYIKTGENDGLDKRFKCLRRHPWYSIPSLHSSVLIYGKRSSVYPRMLLNEEKFLVTDSFYRIYMKGNCLETDLIYSFYNRLTFIFAELCGRQYGGGVLELTPSEFRDLPIPLMKATRSDITLLDNMLKSEGIDSVLKASDDVALKTHLKLTSREIKLIAEIYKKLLKSRIKSAIQTH